MTAVSELVSGLDAELVRLGYKPRRWSGPKALEAVYDQVVGADLAEWNQDPELLNSLANL